MGIFNSRKKSNNEAMQELTENFKEKLSKELEKVDFYSDRKLLEEIYKELITLKINLS